MVITRTESVNVLKYEQLKKNGLLIYFLKQPNGPNFIGDVNLAYGWVGWTASSIQCPLFCVLSS